MTKRVLTATAIAKLKPPASGQVERFDASLPGFGVRVSYRGTKSYVLLYRFAGKLRRATLGQHPVMKLSEAREKARGMLAAASEGRDPRTETLSDRLPETYAEVVEEFIEKFRRPRSRTGVGGISGSCF